VSFSLFKDDGDCFLFVDCEIVFLGPVVHVIGGFVRPPVWIWIEEHVICMYIHTMLSCLGLVVLCVLHL
jgi:hypothetical protein